METNMNSNILLVEDETGLVLTLTDRLRSEGYTVEAIYDGITAGGTLIGTITKPATLLSDSTQPVIYDVACGTGICIVTSGAAQDITVTYQS